MVGIGEVSRLAENQTLVRHCSLLDEELEEASLSVVSLADGSARGFYVFTKPSSGLRQSFKETASGASGGKKDYSQLRYV